MIYANVNKNGIFIHYNKLLSIFHHVEVDELKTLRDDLNDTNFLVSKEDYIQYINNLYNEWCQIKDKNIFYEQLLEELNLDLQKIIFLSLKI